MTEEMRQELDAITEFCSAANTFDLLMECMTRANDFNTKWGLPQPLILQGLPQAQVEAARAI